jgi:hypothetical protein
LDGKCFSPLEVLGVVKYHQERGGISKISTEVIGETSQEGKNQKGRREGKE